MRIARLEGPTGATAAVAVGAGFNCFSLEIPVGRQRIAVLDAEPGFDRTLDQPTRSGIPLLFPFPNRIAGAAFTWNGARYHLPGPRHDARGNAIHGLVFDRPFRVVDHQPNSLRGQFWLSRDAPDRAPFWPADFQIEVCYELRDFLLCRVTVTNPGGVPLPFGLGTHPYFRVPLVAGSRRDDCLLQAPVGKMWQLADNLPTGDLRDIPEACDPREGLPLAGLAVDALFTALQAPDGAVETRVMDPSAGIMVTQRFDPVFRELVMFTPSHGRSVCLEPYTCATDAINLASRGVDAGLVVLPPGGRFQAWFSIGAGPIYV